MPFPQAVSQHLLPHRLAFSRTLLRVPPKGQNFHLDGRSHLSPPHLGALERDQEAREEEEDKRLFLL